MPLFLYPGYVQYTLPEPGTAVLYTNPNPPTVLYAATAPDYTTAAPLAAGATAAERTAVVSMYDADGISSCSPFSGALQM